MKIALLLSVLSLSLNLSAAITQQEQTLDGTLFTGNLPKRNTKFAAFVPDESAAMLTSIAYVKLGNGQFQKKSHSTTSGDAHIQLLYSAALRLCHYENAGTYIERSWQGRKEHPIADVRHRPARLRIITAQQLNHWCCFSMTKNTQTYVLSNKFDNLDPAELPSPK